jgi:hypothetical protein
MNTYMMYVVTVYTIIAMNVVKSCEVTNTTQDLAINFYPTHLHKG